MLNKELIKIVFANVFILSSSAILSATPVTVPDGTFTTGGTLVSILGTQSDVQLGTSPWYASNSGVLSLVLAPTISTNSTTNTANISGLLGLGVAGITNNASGDLFQSLPTLWQANTVYTFGATVTVSGLLNTSLLGDGSTGLKLTTSVGNAPGTVLAATNLSLSGSSININVLNSTTEQIQLRYQTGNTAPTGGIGIDLFTTPTSALSLSVGSNIAFSNLTLDAQAVPEPREIAMIGISLALLVYIQKKRRPLY